MRAGMRDVGDLNTGGWPPKVRRLASDLVVRKDIRVTIWWL
jgi:hypothetical protein